MHQEKHSETHFLKGQRVYLPERLLCAPPDLSPDAAAPGAIPPETDDDCAAEVGAGEPNVPTNVVLAVGGGESTPFIVV